MGWELHQPEHTGQNSAGAPRCEVANARAAVSRMRHRPPERRPVEAAAAGGDGAGSSKSESSPPPKLRNTGPP
jgi:hypothetical protein